MTKLSKTQKDILPILMVADEIHYGVIWYRKYTNLRGKKIMDTLDGRACNALVRKGILVPVEGNRTRYILKLEEQASNDHGTTTEFKSRG